MMSNHPCGGRKLERRERTVPDVIQSSEIRTRLVPPSMVLSNDVHSLKKRKKNLPAADVMRARKNGDPCLEIVCVPGFTSRRVSNIHFNEYQC